MQARVMNAMLNVAARCEAFPDLDAAFADLVAAFEPVPVTDGTVDATGIVAPGIALLTVAIDYAAEQLGVDRDVVIFDLRRIIIDIYSD